MTAVSDNDASFRIEIGTHIKASIKLGCGAQFLPQTSSSHQKSFRWQKKAHNDLWIVATGIKVGCGFAAFPPSIIVPTKILPVAGECSRRPFNRNKRNGNGNVSAQASPPIFSFHQRSFCWYKKADGDPLFGCRELSNVNFVWNPTVPVFVQRIVYSSQNFTDVEVGLWLVGQL